MNATDAFLILLGLYTIAYGISISSPLFFPAIYIVVGIIVFTWGILAVVT